MARIFFNEGQQKMFIERAKERTGLSFKLLAKRCGGHQRSYSDWLHEETSLPQDIALKLSILADVPIPPNVVVKDDFWYTKKAGILGGHAHIQQYGNPGTPEGRRLGGIRSLITHRETQSSFKQRKAVQNPGRSAELAEMCGIILGDGNVSYHQVSITLNRDTDSKYVQCVMQLMKRLFGIDVFVRQIGKTATLVATGINLVEILLRYGLRRGNKIQKQVDMPSWIKTHSSYARACVRGLIDTDGCVYIDRHRHGNKVYRNICLAFTSYSKPLLGSVHRLLLSFKIQSSMYRNNIKIRKRKNVYRYYKTIGTQNQKHAEKLERFFSEPGEVA
ncbi:MAG: hypothetical protein HYV03_00180 [Deltaproteobacteria bacterium]|nr:hypothetical protein [Deltaproteobacteria bacterium]